MFKKAFALAACLLALPAHAQTIAGCGAMTIAKADLNSVAKLNKAATCFEKAGAAASAP